MYNTLDFSPSSTGTKISFTDKNLNIINDNAQQEWFTKHYQHKTNDFIITDIVTIIIVTLIIINIMIIIIIFIITTLTAVLSIKIRSNKVIFIQGRSLSPVGDLQRSFWLKIILCCNDNCISKGIPHYHFQVLNSWLTKDFP